MFSHAHLNSQDTLRLWGNGAVSLLKTDGSIQFLSLPQPTVRTVQLSIDGKHALTDFADGRVWVWDVGEKPDGIPTLAISHQLPGLYTAAAISPDGRQVAVINRAGDANIYDLAEKKIGDLIFEADDDETLTSIAWSNDNQQIATGGRNGILYFWNASNGDLINSSADKDDQQLV